MTAPAEDPQGCAGDCEAFCGPEEWRPAPDNPEQYEVSSHGRVRRSVPGRTGGTRAGRLMTPWPSDRRYLYVHLGGKARGRSVHVLVMRAFGPPRPAGANVDHLDFDRTHNCTGNLRWLAFSLNSVRWWHARDAGRNVWATKDDPPPDDHEPLTPEQEEAALAAAAAAGW